MADNYESFYEGVTGEPEPGLTEQCAYAIRVRGCLDSSWAEWFDGLTVTADRVGGETTIRGQVADQSALHGLLNKVRNLGLVLLEVKRV